MFKAENVENIDSMWDKLGKEILPSGYFMVKMTIPETENYVLTMLEEFDEILGMPEIKKSITIHPNLSYRAHVSCTEISVRKFAGLTATSGIFNKTSEVLNVLSRLKSIRADKKDLIINAADLLDKISPICADLQQNSYA